MRPVTEAEQAIIDDDPRAVCDCGHHLVFHDYDGTGDYCTACGCIAYERRR